jgi:hypothetical protein
MAFSGIYAQRRIQSMGNGFQYAEEHEAYADARREQHREPPRVAVSRFRVGSAKSNAAELRDSETQPEQHENIRDDHEKPVEGRRDPDPEIAENDRGLFLEEHGQDDEPDRKKGRDREDGIVNIEAEYLDIVLADLVADFFGIVFAYIFVFQDQLLGLSAGAGIG